MTYLYMAYLSVDYKQDLTTCIFESFILQCSVYSAVVDVRH